MDLSADREEVPVFVPGAVDPRQGAPRGSPASACDVLETDRGDLRQADRQPAALGQKPGDDAALAGRQLGIPGNENADRTARSARRDPQLLHAKGAAESDQRQLAVACRRRRILRPDHEHVAGRAAALPTAPGSSSATRTSLPTWKARRGEFSLSSTFRGTTRCCGSTSTPAKKWSARRRTRTSRSRSTSARSAAGSITRNSSSRSWKNSGRSSPSSATRVDAALPPLPLRGERSRAV